MSYQKLTSFFYDHPSVQIFEHFSDLNAKSLLYYQAELAQLKAKLERLEARDASCGEEPRSLYHADFWMLKNPEMATEMLSSSDSASGNMQSAEFGEGQDGIGSDGRATQPVDLELAQRQWKLVLEIRSVLEEYCMYCEGHRSPSVPIQIL